MITLFSSDSSNNKRSPIEAAVAAEASAVRASPRRRLQVLLLIAFLGALCAMQASAQGGSGYRVYFKDGSDIATTGPYLVQGEKALLTKPGGTETIVDLKEIDVEKTEENNRGFRSDAVVIDTSGTRRFNREDAARAARPTLQDLIRMNQRRAEDLSSDATSGPDSSPNRIPTTAAGFPNLQETARTPLEDASLDSSLTSILREKGVSQFRLYQGTTRNRLLIEQSAQGRQEVFDQLEAVASAFADVTGMGRFSTLEVLMLDDRRARSAQFELSQENVPLLQRGLLTPSEFFLQYVQF